MPAERFLVHIIALLLICSGGPFKILNFTPFKMSMAIPQGKHWFSSDHRSLALLGGVSTWMGVRLGIPCVVDFSFSRPF